MNNTMPTESFWKDFYDNHWEQKPALFKNLFDSNFISEQCLFDAIVGMKERTPADRFWASRKNPPQSRDDFQQIPLDQHGPRQQDQSLQGFFARARMQIGNIPIGLNIHQLEKAEPTIWFKFREFIYHLNKLSGELPSGRWDIDTFLGNYKCTPLGIHHDNASVFAIGIIGRRRYYTWPADYFSPGDPALNTLDTTQFDKHLDNAVRFDLEPGDLVYWPSSNWHFVTSDGEPSAVISVSAYFGKYYSDLVADEFTALIKDQLGNNDFNRKYQFKDALTSPPQQLDNVVKLVSKMVNTNQFSNAIQKHWLTYSSADGLHPVKKDTTAKLDSENSITVDSRFAITWVALDGELLVSANGNTTFVDERYTKQLTSMLDELNNGCSVKIEELLARHSESDDDVKQILVNTIHQLNAFRAFYKYSESI